MKQILSHKLFIAIRWSTWAVALACLSLSAQLRADEKADLAKAEAIIKKAGDAKLPPASDKKVDFIKDIKPIFDKSCLDCHDKSGPMGKFRIDKREEVMKGGESGPAIIPGKSDKSPIVYYAAHAIKDLEMPPKDQGDPLTKEQVGLLRAWIDQGAKWE